uniref:Choline kinase n=1 Tax=Favella ehrenbergii TaxID=182087 RepID=A0A7S3ML58_9SPIT|mmetsp:Transcript_12394/g.15817  ORF Transcript_12394/g.15817 Transcript_12394/m.15817 type:complete len:318 (+) Transcript_12394:234-1187(+)
MPRVFLYRKFECEVVDKQIEATLFRCMSEAGLGPKLVFQSETFRIEYFFTGRPLSIWEMRNPVIVKKVVEELFNFHTKSGASEAIDAIKPRATSRMGVEIAIEEWGPASIERIASIRQKLNAQDAGHRKILSTLDRLCETYLKNGYQSVLRSCIPAGEVVLTHNDCQENNILLSQGDSANKICLIDYEYGMWNPRMYDLANYLNEMCCDNAYPAGTGVAHFLENWATEEEIVNITRLYYQLEKGENAVWSLDDEECRQRVHSVKQCMVLNCFYWSVWSIMMLTQEEETDPDIYYWEFIESKCDMHQMCVEKFGIGQI